MAGPREVVSDKDTKVFDFLVVSNVIAFKAERRGIGGLRGAMKVDSHGFLRCKEEAHFSAPFCRLF